MQLSFIVLNYKSEEYLKKCLISIMKKAIELEYEIIVVNNDEKKLNALEIYFWDYPEFFQKIQIIEINENVGFSRANNIGARKSVGEYLCFINPDTEIISQDIKKILDEFRINQRVGIIGPKILKNSVVQPWSVGAEMNIREILRSKMGYAKSKALWSSPKKIKVDWVSGACMFVRKNIFDKIGGFDENFFLYYEDVDLCRRIRLENREVIYFPFFEIIHLEGKSSSKKYSQKLEYFKSQDYYYKKWFSMFSLIILKFFRAFYLLGYKIKHSRYLFREKN